MSKKMTNVIVDCEASGPCPTCGDLIQFAAITESGDTFVSDKFPPVYTKYSDGAYNALGIDRDAHCSYTGDMLEEARRFILWLHDYGKVKFWSDNLAFDWQWINWLFHYHNYENPFGFSGRRIGDFYAGLNKNFTKTVQWKKWRVTPHTHDPLDDVKGNLEAFKRIREEFGV